MDPDDMNCALHIHNTIVRVLKDWRKTGSVQPGHLKTYDSAEGLKHFLLHKSMLPRMSNVYLIHRLTQLKHHVVDRILQEKFFHYSNQENSALSMKWYILPNR